MIKTGNIHTISLAAYYMSLALNAGHAKDALAYEDGKRVLYYARHAAHLALVAMGERAE